LRCWWLHRLVMLPTAETARWATHHNSLPSNLFRLFRGKDLAGNVAAMWCCGIAMKQDGDKALNREPRGASVTGRTCALQPSEVKPAVHVARLPASEGQGGPAGSTPAQASRSDVMGWLVMIDDGLGFSLHHGGSHCLRERQSRRTQSSRPTLACGTPSRFGRSSWRPPIQVGAFAVAD